MRMPWPDTAPPKWLGRAKPAWPVALTLLVFVIALAIGAIVRQELRVDQSFWVVQPALYIARSEHAADHVPLVLLVGSTVLMAGIIWVIRRVDPPLRPVPEVLVALCVGGGGVLANFAEVLARASVTDFLGVHGPNGGVYSAGDIAISTGIALMPVAGFASVRPAHGTTTALLAGAAFFAWAILINVVLPGRLGPAALVTIVAIAAVAWLATKGARLRVGRSSET